MQVQEKPVQNRPSAKKFTKINVAFAFSFCCHLLLLSLIGGVVLQYGKISTKNFTAETIEPSAESEMTEPPEPEATPDESPQALSEAEQPSSGSPAMPAPEVITSSIPSPSISVQAFTTPVAPSSFGTGTGAGESGTGSGATSGKGSGMRKMASLFGSTEISSEGLTGYLYDLKQSSDRKPLATDASQVIKALVDKWDERTLQKFYKVPNPLTSFQWFIPMMGADGAPKAFHAENEVQPNNWLIFYQGKITSNVSGSFRFVGIGDDVLLVRFNRKFVFDGGWFAQFAKEMNNEKGEFNGPFIGNSDMKLRIGTWFTVRAGETYPMEVLIGEIPGNAFSQFLLIQQRGREYEKRADGQGVLLPIFQIGQVEPPVYEPGKNGPLTSGKTFSFTTPPESAQP